MSIKSNEENDMKSTVTRSSDELVGRKIATGFVRTSNSVEDNSHDHWVYLVPFFLNY